MSADLVHLILHLGRQLTRTCERLETCLLCIQLTSNLRHAWMRHTWSRAQAGAWTTKCAHASPPSGTSEVISSCATRAICAAPVAQLLITSAVTRLRACSTR